jgi:hypothetical protein
VLAVPQLQVFLFCMQMNSAYLHCVIFMIILGDCLFKCFYFTALLSLFSEFHDLDLYLLSVIYSMGLKRKCSQVLVPHAYDPSYSGGRDQEDCGSKPAQANSL